MPSTVSRAAFDQSDDPMIQGGLEVFAGRRILLLQGPVGPFFRRLAQDLAAHDAQVFKVNFNAGDWLFYPRGALSFREPLGHWPDWLQTRLRLLRIDLIFLFGDCRPMHREALKVARRMGVEVGVFEEGYVRPDFVTLERLGVNGYSTLPRTDGLLADAPFSPPVQEHLVGNTYSAMAWRAFAYGAALTIGRGLFPHYAHHRPVDLLEGLRWLRAAWRKVWFRTVESGAERRLFGPASGRYFLVPLQVSNDAQVKFHSGFRDVSHFIGHVLQSFAQHAPSDSLLVFKHHPMDRGHTDYTRLIRELAARDSLRGRVLYIHDQHLPALLEHARGVVVINSTVGLSALQHHRPTLACGSAIYDLPGLTYQGAIDDFWGSAPDAAPDPVLLGRFRDSLIRRTQLNGNFYKRLAQSGNRCGLVWPTPLPSRAPDQTPTPLRTRASEQAVKTQSRIGSSIA